MRFAPRGFITLEKKDFIKSFIMVKYNFVNFLPFVQGTGAFLKKTFGKRSALCSLKGVHFYF